MNLRELTLLDLAEVGFNETPDGPRLVVDLTCSACGAYQAADSDPADEDARDRLGALAVRLFNSVGWRANDEKKVLCPACAKTLASTG